MNNPIIKAIEKIVAENCYVTIESMWTPTRKRESVDAKHILRVHLLRLFNEKSSELERITGVDHSNYLHSHKMYEQLYSTDKLFAFKASKCADLIKAWEEQYLTDADVEEKLSRELEPDYEPFAILIRMIEAGHKREDILLNLPRCKKRINYLAGYKYFDV